MNNLTERQKALYSYLLRCAENRSDLYINKSTICYYLSGYYPRYSEDSTEHNSKAYCDLRKDVRAINFSNVEKIIVSSPKGYKIATKEEAESYIKRRLKSSLVSLKLYWNIKRKMGNDKQIDMNLHEVETYIGEQYE